MPRGYRASSSEAIYKRIRPNRTGAGGHSLEIRIPKEVIDLIGITENTELLVKVDGKRRIILESARRISNASHLKSNRISFARGSQNEVAAEVSGPPVNITSLPIPQRGKNISALHNYMVSEVVRLIKKEGYVKIEHVAESGELSNADITTNFKEIEVETGLQKKLDGLKKRIDRAVTTSNKEVLIIVPNKYVRQRYDEFVKDYAQGRVLVRTFGEFEDSVLAGLEMLKRGKTKQEE